MKENQAQKKDLITKTFKIERELCEKFKIACIRAKITQSQAFQAYLEDFIAQYSEEDHND